MPQFLFSSAIQSFEHSISFFIPVYNNYTVHFQTVQPSCFHAPSLRVMCLPEGLLFMYHAACSTEKFVRVGLLTLQENAFYIFVAS